MAVSIRRSPTAPTPATGWRCASCRAVRRSIRGSCSPPAESISPWAPNLIQTFDAVRQKVPVVDVASLFQIDPVVLMSHPGVGYDRFEDLPKAPTAFIASDNLVTVYQWLKHAYGFREEKVKPYGFNPAPFIADKNSIQQGFSTSEPYPGRAPGRVQAQCVPARRLWL